MYLDYIGTSLRTEYVLFLIQLAIPLSLNEAFCKILPECMIHLECNYPCQIAHARIMAQICWLRWTPSPADDKQVERHCNRPSECHNNHYDTMLLPLWERRWQWHHTSSHLCRCEYESLWGSSLHMWRQHYIICYCKPQSNHSLSLNFSWWQHLLLQDWASLLLIHLAITTTFQYICGQTARLYFIGSIVKRSWIKSFCVTCKKACGSPTQYQTLHHYPSHGHSSLHPSLSLGRTSLGPCVHGTEAEKKRLTFTKSYSSRSG